MIGEIWDNGQLDWFPVSWLTRGMKSPLLSQIAGQICWAAYRIQRKKRHFAFAESYPQNG
jgi:hypothetical protein